MNHLFEIRAELRETQGKGASRRLRRESGLVPAILYGGGQPPLKLSFKSNEIRKATSNEAFFSHILTLQIQDEKQQVVIKALQRHPVKDDIIHLDFLRINASEKLEMSVPLHFLGEAIAPGIKNSGGIVSHLMTDINIRCLPANLPEFIEVDVSKLGLNEALHLKDLVLPTGVELAYNLEEEGENLTVVTISSVKEVADIQIGPAAVPTLADQAAAKAASEGGDASSKKKDSSKK